MTKRPKAAATSNAPTGPPGLTAADGYLAGMLDFTAVLDKDLREIHARFARLRTDEARAAFAGGWVRTAARELEKTWVLFYELLRVIRDKELYRDPGCMGLPRDPPRQYESFEAYFEAVVRLPFARWNELEATYQFVHTYAPDLLNGTLSDANAKRAEQARLEQEQMERQPHGGDRHSTAFKFNNIKLEAPQGTSSARALRDLRKKRPDIHARVLAGEMSPHAGMLAAGLRKRTLTVPSDSHGIAAAIKRHFTPDQIAEIVRLLHWSKDV